MREIINLLESVGLSNRKPGDRWQNPQGDEIIFSDLNFYPESGAFETPEEMAAAISEVAQKIGVQSSAIFWTNQLQSSSKAFGIAHFVDAENKDYYIGRYYKSISPNRSENSFSNDLPGGFRLQTRAAKKERAGYKPTDVLGGNLNNLTPNDIYAGIVQKFGEASDEARATAAYMAHTGTGDAILPLGNMNFEAFTNYFCEMLQPMALVMNKARKGNANKAEDKFLTQGGFDTCTITFGGGKNEGLTDSTLTNPAGQALGLSSKAKGGAKASTKNLNDKVTEMRGDPDGQQILDKYKEEVSLLQMIVDGGQAGAPLNLAMAFGMITPEEKQQVLSLRKLGIKDFNPDMLSDNLQALWNARSAADPSKIVPFYHMLAAIAYPVADYVNSNTNFSRAAADILNFGAFIQAQTYATKKGDTIILKPFEFTYPSTATTGVLLSAKKPYYSTGLKGNFTFQILKNGATAEEVEMADAQVDTKPDIDMGQDLDLISQRRSDVTAAGRTGRAPGDEKILGRRRRK